MVEEYRKVGENLGLELDKKLKFERHSLYGHCFRVVGRSEYTRIRNKSEYIQYTTQKSGTLFATRTLKELSSKHADISKKYDIKQRGLAREVVEIVGKKKIVDSIILQIFLMFYISYLLPIFGITWWYNCSYGRINKVYILKKYKKPSFETKIIKFCSCFCNGTNALCSTYNVSSWTRKCRFRGCKTSMFRSSRLRDIYS